MIKINDKAAKMIDQRNERRGCEILFTTWFSLVTINDKVTKINDKVINIARGTTDPGY